MMQLARRASLVVVLLLASLGTASAECAWVLWNKITITADRKDVHERWQLIGAGR